MANFGEEVRDNDWSVRRRIEKMLQEPQIVFKDSFNLLNKIPFITFDRHLVPNSDQSKRKLISCFSPETLSALSKDCQCNFYIFDPQIGRNCPFVLSLLKCTYLETRAILKLSHRNNNMETTNQIVNEIFRELSSNRDIEVFNVTYLALSVCYSSQMQHTIRKIDYRTLEDFTVKQTLWNKLPYVILGKKWIVCTGFKEEIVKVYIQALIQLLVELKPMDSLESIRESVHRNAAARLFDAFRCKSASSVAAFASSEDSLFDMDEVVFPSEIVYDNLSDVYFNGIVTDAALPDTDAKMRQSFVDFNFTAIEKIFKSRVEDAITEKICHINDRRLKGTENEMVKQQKIVNTELQKAIGIRAEYFFCCYLKSLYGESFNEFENWLSSAKLKVFTIGSFCDDSLGYDFEINDHKQIFATKQSRNSVRVKKCFIEVKGCSGAWDGTFHVTKNELEKCRGVLKDSQSYIVAVVQNAESDRYINVARIINWSDENDILKYEPDSYIVRFNFSAANYNEKKDRKLSDVSKNDRNKVEMSQRNSVDIQVKNKNGKKSENKSNLIVKDDNLTKKNEVFIDKNSNKNKASQKKAVDSNNWRRTCDDNKNSSQNSMIPPKYNNSSVSNFQNNRQFQQHCNTNLNAQNYNQTSILGEYSPHNHFYKSYPYYNHDVLGSLPINSNNSNSNKSNPNNKQ